MAHSPTSPTHEYQRRQVAIKLSCLLLLTVQTSGLILFMRHSLRGSRYNSASVVVMVEVVKLLLGLLAEMVSQPRGFKSARSVWNNLRRDIAQHGRSALLLAVPAGLYAVQNNLSYFALARLSAVSFQVLQQLKILTTALMAVLMMGKRLGLRHWAALLLLTAGVILVQIANLKEAKAPAAVSGAESLDAWLGFGAMLLNSASSGFAGIFFERLVKSHTRVASRSLVRRGSILPLDHKTTPKSSALPRSVWLQSVELGFFGLLFSLALAAAGDNGRRIWRDGFFHGYDRLTWIIIGMQAIGGMLVALVVRYADSILKAFSTAASIVLSSVITVALLGDNLSWGFLGGTFLVILSVYLYALADRQQFSRSLKIH